MLHSRVSNEFLAQEPKARELGHKYRQHTEWVRDLINLCPYLPDIPSKEKDSPGLSQLVAKAALPKNGDSQNRVRVSSFLSEDYRLGSTCEGGNMCDLLGSTPTAWCLVTIRKEKANIKMAWKTIHRNKYIYT